MKSLTIEDLVKEYKKTANEHGWSITWNNTPTYLMLIVSELSEALEAYRDNKKLHFTEEIADSLIRIFHLIGDLNLDIESALGWKMMINKTRPYKHGRKRI